MFYLKEDTLLQKKPMSSKSCECCESIGMLGVESIHLSSGADENLLDKQSDGCCPVCGKVFYH